MQLPTVEEYWKLSRNERLRLYEDEGITGKFLAEYWKPYNDTERIPALECLTAIRGVKQIER